MKLYDLLCSSDDSVKLACIMCERFTEQEWTDALQDIWSMVIEQSEDINRYWTEDEMYSEDGLSFGYVRVLGSTDKLLEMDVIKDLCSRIIEFIEL